MLMYKVLKKQNTHTQKETIKKSLKVPNQRNRTFIFDS